MPAQLMYKIRKDPRNKEYSLVKGPKGQLVTFYRVDANNWGATNGARYCYIEFIGNGVLDTKAYLKFSSPSKLDNFIVSYEASKNIQVDGDYKGASNNINWSWKYDTVYHQIILIDNNEKGIIMAKIEGFTLNSTKKGSLEISPETPADFREAIITTACIIWTIKRDSDFNYSLKADEKSKRFKKYNCLPITKPVKLKFFNKLKTFIY